MAQRLGTKPCYKAKDTHHLRNLTTTMHTSMNTIRDTKAFIADLLFNTFCHALRGYLAWSNKDAVLSFYIYIYGEFFHGMIWIWLLLLLNLFIQYFGIMGHWTRYQLWGNWGWLKKIVGQWMEVERGLQMKSWVI